MRERVIKGIADAITDSEEVVGIIDSHDLAYARGLRAGFRVLALLAERERGREVAADVMGVQARLAAASKEKK